MRVGALSPTNPAAGVRGGSGRSWRCQSGLKQGLIPPLRPASRRMHRRVCPRPQLVHAAAGRGLARHMHLPDAKLARLARMARAHERHEELPASSKGEEARVYGVRRPWRRECAGARWRHKPAGDEVGGVPRTSHAASRCTAWPSAILAAQPQAARCHLLVGRIQQPRPADRTERVIEHGEGCARAHAWRSGTGRVGPPEE